MAAEWLDADREQLYMALELVDAFWRKPSAGILRELRAILAAFGLDPIARRRLDWVMKPAGQKGDAGKMASDAAVASSREPDPTRPDPRALLGGGVN